MTMKPEFGEYIRTLIRGDNAENDRIEAQLDQEGWDDFAKFQAALFFLAVDRRFQGKVDEPRIIQFVSSIRQDLAATGGPQIDQQAAETLIKAAIDESVDYNLDQHTIGKIQGATIYKVLTEAELSDEDLKSILAEAASIANRSA